MIVRNLSSGRVLGSQVRQADSFWLRLRGLMFRSGLEPGEGLLIRPCQAVHTHFMRFHIDVLFLDEGMRVVRILRGMAPWRLSPQVGGAVAVLEVAAGAAVGTQLGDRLGVEEGEL